MEPTYTFPTGDEVVADLPAGTSVDEERAQSFIDSAKARLADCYGSDGLPANANTVHLIWQLGYARSLKHHFVKGEGYLETPTADEEIARAENALNAHCEEVRKAREEAAAPDDAYAAHFGQTPF